MGGGVGGSSQVNSSLIPFWCKEGDASLGRLKQAVGLLGGVGCSMTGWVLHSYPSPPLCDVEFYLYRC